MAILRALALTAAAMFLASCQNPGSPPPDYTTFNDHGSYMNQTFEEAAARPVEAHDAAAGQPG